MFYITLNNIKLNMYVGIRDFEYLNKQSVVINIKLYGNIPLYPKNIEECLDYTKVFDYIASWEKRKHVDLLETLLFDLLEFCFKDSRIMEVDAEIVKPDIIAQTDSVGVGMNITREIYELKKSPNK